MRFPATHVSCSRTDGGWLKEVYHRLLKAGRWDTTNESSNRVCTASTAKWVWCRVLVPRTAQQHCIVSNRLRWSGFEIRSSIKQNWNYLSYLPKCASFLFLLSEFLKLSPTLWALGTTTLFWRLKKLRINWFPFLNILKCTCYAYKIFKVGNMRQCRRLQIALDSSSVVYSLRCVNITQWNRRFLFLKHVHIDWKKSSAYIAAAHRLHKDRTGVVPTELNWKETWKIISLYNIKPKPYRCRRYNIPVFNIRNVISTPIKTNGSVKRVTRCIF